MIRPVARRAPAPLLGVAALFGAGVWAGGWSVEGTGLAAAGAALAGVALAAGRSRPALWAGVLAVFAGFAAGRAGVGRPAEQAADAWARVDPDRPVSVLGTLEDHWNGAADRRWTRVRAETIAQSGMRARFPAEIAVEAYGAAPLPGARGERVVLTLSIGPPDDPVSARDLPAPGRLWRGSIKSGWQASVVASPLTALPGKVNAFLARRLFGAALPRDTVQAPVAALLLGRAAELDRGEIATLRQGGFAHVLLASGLQVALFAALLAAALRAAGVRRRARDAWVLAGVAGFALLAGGRPSVSRMALTIAFFLAARLVELPVSPYQAIGASALVLLAADPAELWRFGFWTTYGASLSIAALSPPIASSLRRLPERLRIPVAVAVAAQLAAAPLMLWRFNAAAIASWIAAPLGIPVAAALMLLGGAVLAAVAAGLPAAVPAAAFGALFRATSAGAAALRSGTLLVPTPPFPAVVVLLGLAAATAVLSGRRRAVPAVAYAVLFAVLAFRGARGPRGGAFSIEALDVGQGDAFLLRSGGAAFLVDGGGGFSGAEDFGRTRLLPKLLDRGVRTLDGVLLSHPHPDHGAGLFAVLGELRVRTFFHGDGEDAGGLFARLDAEARRQGVPVRVLRTGERIPWAGGTFSVIRSGGRPFKKDPINNESVVLLYTRGNRRVLLTGDAGEPAESEILAALPAPPRIDILKVGHHGSRTSSGPDFVAAFAPRAALLSCGRRNRFHHPSPETLATFGRLRIPVFRTDLRSDVGFLVTPAHLLLRERGRP